MSTATESVSTGNGRYVNLAIDSNGDLNISPSSEAIEEMDWLLSLLESAALGEMFEDWIGNKDWDWVYPEELAALTDAPIIGYDIMRDDDGNLERSPEFAWWHESYQVESAVECILKKGLVVFKKAE